MCHALVRVWSGAEGFILSFPTLGSTWDEAMECVPKKKDVDGHENGETAALKTGMENYRDKLVAPVSITAVVYHKSHTDSLKPQVWSSRVSSAFASLPKNRVLPLTSI